MLSIKNTEHRNKHLWHTVQVSFLFLLLVSCRCSIYAKKEGRMADEYKEALDAVIQSTGEEYLTARESLVNNPMYALQLEQTAKSSESWQSVWAAKIVLSWQRDRDLHEQAQKYIDGDLPGRPPITGEFDEKARASAIAELGPDITPFLIEILWKLQTYDDDVELASVAIALVKLAQPETENPLLDILDSNAPDHYKHAAISTLSETRSWKALPKIQQILNDKNQPVQTRIVALGSFIEYNTDGQFKDLSSIVKNKEEHLDLRVYAAHTLAWGKNEGTKELFHEIIESENEDAILNEAITGIKRNGDESSIEKLKTLKQQIKNKNLEKKIDLAIKRLESGK